MLGGDYLEGSATVFTVVLSATSIPLGLLSYLLRKLHDVTELRSNVTLAPTCAPRSTI